MFGSAVLEVGIGLTFFYLLFSVLCSAIQEWISGLLALRGENLHRGIANLLHDGEATDLCEQLYAHPLIQSLGKPRRAYTVLGEKLRRPSYIPPKVFSSVLLDLLQDPARPKNLAQEFTSLIENLPNDGPVGRDLKKILHVFANDADDDLDQFRNQIEEWYSHCMDRVSGWYKRKAQAIIFVIASVITFAVNADTLIVVNTLWHDSALRTRITYLAESAAPPVSNSQGKSAEPDPALENAQTKIRQSALGLEQFPLGWNSEPLSASNPLGVPSGSDWLTKILGLLVTVFSVSLGAPFWFDLMSKLIRVRSSVQADGNPK